MGETTSNFLVYKLQPPHITSNFLMVAMAIMVAMVVMVAMAMVVMLVMGVLVVMVVMLVMVVVVNMVVMVDRTRQDRTKLTFKLDFPGNL